MPRNPGDFSSTESENVFSGLLRPDSSPRALQEALDQLLASKTFSRSGQLKRILLYLRESADSTDPAVWSETSIGAIAFGRKDFNPKLDTIVRVEMRRLRQKLDEYYSTEGVSLPLRLRFEKNTYRPFVEPHVPEPAETGLTPTIEIPPPPVRDDRFWKGAAAGGAAVAGLLSLAALIWYSVFNPNPAPPRVLTESPIWSGFKSTNVVIAIGTPLFFRSASGFERKYSINLPQDLDSADQLLTTQPAFPIWNILAPLEDVSGAVTLDRFLRSMKSTVISISAARQISYGALSGKRTIVMGQPRTAPLLIDLLADQPFRPRQHVVGKTFAGFDNSEPRPGEPRHYPNESGRLLMQSDESSPDYALLTTIRLPNGGEVLNFFGDRIQTAGYIARKLTDPVFISELNARVFDKSKPGYQSAQVVFRVDYSRSIPTGLVYQTHRIRYPNR